MCVCVHVSFTFITIYYFFHSFFILFSCFSRCYLIYSLVKNVYTSKKEFRITWLRYLWRTPSSIINVKYFLPLDNIDRIRVFFFTSNRDFNQYHIEYVSFELIKRNRTLFISDEVRQLIKFKFQISSSRIGPRRQNERRSGGYRCRSY